MNVKTALKLVVAVVVVSAMTSCNKSGNYNYDKVSRGTGWELTGENGGLSYVTDYSGQITGPGLVFIPGGTFTMGKVADDPLHEWNNEPTQQTVASFYMDETEVTNGMYLEYLNWLKRTFPASKTKYSRIYKGALPDTLVWRSPLGKRSGLVNNYLRHPAYRNYPVVGVSWIQAVEFSQWRSDRVNEKILVDAGVLPEDAMYNHPVGTQFSADTYLAVPSAVYGEGDSLIHAGKNADKYMDVAFGDTLNTTVQMSEGLLLPDYRLPTEAEWEYAAIGMSSDRVYNNYRGRKKYPWDGSYTASNHKRSRGDQLANFKQGYGDYAGIAGWSSDGAIVTNAIKSYPPNAYGLYDMAGNVAEWVADVYRPDIKMKLNDFNYYRGNVYKQNVIMPDGTVKIIDAESIDYDTLRTGQIVARELPGEIARKKIDQSQLYFRLNYDRADNRAYRAGDKQSSRYYWQRGQLSNAERMYNSPLPKMVRDKDSTGNVNMYRQYDSNNRTTLISLRTRVVKGGSWKDNAYWLQPGTRRFYPQNMATNWIGFRCAMSHVGPSFKKGRRTKRN